MLDYNALKQQFQFRPQRTAALVLSLAFILLIITIVGYRAIFPGGAKDSHQNEIVRSERIFRSTETQEQRLDTLQDTTVVNTSASSADSVLHQNEMGHSVSPRADHVDSASNSTGGLLVVMVFMLLMLVLLYVAVGYLRRRGIPGRTGSIRAPEQVNGAPVQMLYTETIGHHEQLNIMRVANKVHVCMHTAGATPLLLQTMSVDEWEKESGVKP